nr:brain protein I3 isoform X2 [Equus asinus]
MSAPVHLLLECKGAFPSPVLGSLPRPRGVSLKLAMSTVQAAGIPTHHPRVYNIHSRNVTRYPANSIVVVGGCPVCRVGAVSFRRPVASANRGPAAPVIQNLDQESGFWRTPSPSWASSWPSSCSPSGSSAVLP